MEEDSKSSIIHLQPTHHPFGWHVFLLFIPAIVFALVAAYFSSQTKHYAANTAEDQAVLGEEANK